MVLVVIAGFVTMRVMSLKILDVIMTHLRGRHIKRTTNVGGLIGRGVQEQCTSECCGFCLCVYGGGRGDIHRYRRKNACSHGYQTSKVHATGTSNSLLLYYMWISIVCLCNVSDIDHHVVLVHYTLHSIALCHTSYYC